MNDLIFVKLSVESMKHEIMHAFTSHQLEIGELVKEAVTSAITDSHIGDEIRCEAIRLLRDEVKREVQSVIWKILSDEAAKAVIAKGIREAIMIAVEHSG